MGIKTEWVAENSNIVLLVVEDKWTWEDYREAMNQMYDMMEA